MRGFRLDEKGDVVLTGGEIACVENGDLMAQSIEKLIATNHGEWWLNTRQGVEFRNILGKNPNVDLIRNEIQQALLQIDENLLMDEFTHTIDGRVMHIQFTAKNRTGATVTVATDFKN